MEGSGSASNSEPCKATMQDSLVDISASQYLSPSGNVGRPVMTGEAAAAASSSAPTPRQDLAVADVGGFEDGGEKRKNATTLSQFSDVKASIPTTLPTTADSTSSLLAITSSTGSLSLLPAHSSGPVASPLLGSIRQLYNRAARAFLQRDYRTTLICNERAYSIARQLQIPTSETSQDQALAQTSTVQTHKLWERIVVLRLTAYITAYTLPSISTSASQVQQQDSLQSLEILLQQSAPGSEERAAVTGETEVDRTENAKAAASVLYILSLSAADLLARLWYDALYLFAMDERLSAAATSIIKQKIEPSPHTINLPLGLPASSLSSCVLAALKTGDAATQVASASSKGLGGVDKKETSAARNSLMAKEKYVEAQQAYLCARHMCEWYLAAYSGWSSSPYTLPSTQETKERLTSSYTKLLDLYTLQVLGPKFAEWDYAREMLAYSSLTQDVKEKLLVKLDSVQEHHEHRAERTRVASGDLKARIEKEKERRAEMAVKEAAAATSSKRASAQGANSVAGEKSSRLRSQSSGGSSPPAELRRRRSDDTPGAYGDGAHKPTSMSSSAASSTASLLRNNTSGDRKSDAPAFGISSAASLPPPATSSSLADKGTDGGKRDKWRAGSASSSASTNGSGSERETAGERGTKQGQGELHRTDTNEASFVATRAHIANTIERHRSRDLSSTSFSSPRGVSRRPETNPGNSPAGLTGYLAQARAYVLQLPSTSGVVLSYASIGIVLMFVLRRALARGSKTLANRRTEIHPARASASFSAAAQEARRKLAKRRQEESGFAKWVLGIWWRALGKIWQTIRMATQVTYL